MPPPVDPHLAHGALHEAEGTSVAVLNEMGGVPTDLAVRQSVVGHKAVLQFMKSDYPFLVAPLGLVFFCRTVDLSVLGINPCALADVVGEELASGARIDKRG